MIRTMTATALVLALAVSSADARPRHHARTFTTDSTQYLPHPAGCPRYAFCGCGARKDLGLSDVRLNLAWNWTKYYHGPTPVAVWRHHIAIIERWTGPNTAILRDYNSGGGLSRRHERSLAGARIVGSRFASR